jgi:hypothetical protein
VRGMSAAREIIAAFSITIIAAIIATIMTQVFIAVTTRTG